MDSRPKAMFATIERYMRALGDKQRDVLLGMFADTIVIRDPVGKNEHVGKEAVAAYLDSLFQTWHYYEMRTDNYFPGSEDRLAVRWSCSGTAVNNKTADFSGISIFVFEGTDTIVSIDSYWYYDRILDKIKD